MKEKETTSDSALEIVLRKRKECLDDRLSAQILEEYMLTIQNLDIMYKDIKYSLLLDMNMIEMRSPEAIYPDFYLQKRSIMSELAENYYGGGFRKISFQKNEKRIAIHTNTWRDERYSIGIVIATLANEFSRQGYEVTIFIENQCKHDAKIRDVLNPDLLLDAEDYCLEHRRMLLPKINICYSKGESIKDKIVNQVNNIFAFGPALILDIADENSCCSRILYRKFPVFYFPMRSNHGTSMFFHKYLAVDPERTKQVIKKYRCFDEKLVVSFTGGITGFPEAKVYYDKKKELGTEDAFVLVTVGNRLVYDLSREFICFIVSLLQQNPCFVWLFVGADIPDFLLQERARLKLHDQIIVRGYENDLVALYQICDVYVNPGRKGGGLSIAWAMHEGLPIAMLKYVSDGLSWIGEENAIDGGMEELGNYIFSLWNDPVLYEKAKEKMKERANQRTPKKCVEQIVELINEKG